MVSKDRSLATKLTRRQKEPSASSQGTAFPWRAGQIRGTSQRRAPPRPGNPLPQAALHMGAELGPGCPLTSFWLGEHLGIEPLQHGAGGSLPSSLTR